MANTVLNPCPVCGAKAEILQIRKTQYEHSGMFECSMCGFKMEYERPSKVVNGIEIFYGYDPIEAWNHLRFSNDCEKCGVKLHIEAIAKLHDCNDCADLRECNYAPKIGQWTRINCPLWRGEV